MYGGHITDQWDRRVCNTYLLTLVLPELLSNMNLAPGFKSPDASKMEYSSYQKCLGAQQCYDCEGWMALDTGSIWRKQCCERCGLRYCICALGEMLRPLLPLKVNLSKVRYSMPFAPRPGVTPPRRWIWQPRFIEERFPAEMPQLFGLHPNAEIGFLTSQGINIFKTVQRLASSCTWAWRP